MHLARTEEGDRDSGRAEEPVDKCQVGDTNAQPDLLQWSSLMLEHRPKVRKILQDSVLVVVEKLRVQSVPGDVEPRDATLLFARMELSRCLKGRKSTSVGNVGNCLQFVNGGEEHDLPH